jgi:selenocysteine-specific elongation factor
MILGTAGHIDHGKTTLVRALTGVDTDRLPEEKRRGITIDLGFAPLVLDGVGTLGVVDVPGHEAFVRTMVAGAAGVDLALVVVAADEGVMPQTREHLAILGLLGVDAGVIALTKSDLVDEDWLALVEEDVRAVLDGTPLAQAPIVRVSATTGAGLPELRRALVAEALRRPRERESDLFRLPIDRAFTVRGTGSVVTGTVWSGTLELESTLRLLPAGESVRVRGLQAHGHGVERVQEGERAAIALQGVDIDRLARGAVLVQGDAWRPSRVLRADVTLLADVPKEIGPRRKVRFHLGTADIAARLVGLDRVIEPGDLTSARIVLDEPVVARAGDRFVLRDASPARTIGGGVITDPLAPPRARPWPLEARTPVSLLARILNEAGAHGVAVGELPVRLGVAPARIPELMASLDTWRVGKLLLGADARVLLAAEACRLVESHHAEHPLDFGAPQQWVRSRLSAPDDVAVATLDRLEGQGALVAEQGLVHLPGFAPRLSAAEESLRARLLAALDASAHEPPTLDELGTALGVASASLADVARLLAREGTLVAVEPARYYRAQTVDELVARLRAGMAPDTGFGPSELRELLGFSRKFLIPFLEYCDRVGVTRRDLEGKRRILAGARTIS